MQDDRNTQLYAAWIDAFDRERPSFDRAGVRSRVLASFEASEPRRGWPVFAIAAAAVVVLAAGIATRSAWSPTTTFMVGDQQGEIGEWVAPVGGQDLHLNFSDGTDVALAVGTRARVEAVDSRGAHVEIERGSVTAHVSHRARTSWQFGAGPFDVHVVGTSLSVDWDPEAGAFELAVERGAVVVKGPLIQGSQEVRAGERCVVDLQKQSVVLKEAVAAAPHPTNALPEPPTTTEQMPASIENARAPSNARSSPSIPAWLRAVRDGKYDEALEAAEKSGFARIYQSASAEQLLELGRAARQAGRSDVERDAFLSCRRRFQGPPASKAAYLLGRAAAPKEAADWFEIYLREQPRGLLAREAAGRLIESLQRAGNTAAARDAAARYLAAYPDGPHGALARSLVGASRRDGN